MKGTELTDYERLLCIINGVQDFGVVGGMGDIVDNDKLAKALSERGCIVAKPMPNVRRRRYANERMKKVLKEAGKSLTALTLWLAMMILIFLLDDATGNLLSDNEFTKILMQTVITATMVLALLFLKAKMITAIVTNILAVAFIWAIASVGMAQSLVVIMLFGLIPICRRGDN